MLTKTFLSPEKESRPDNHMSSPDSLSARSASTFPWKYVHPGASSGLETLKCTTLPTQLLMQHRIISSNFLLLRNDHNLQISCCIGPNRYCTKLLLHVEIERWNPCPQSRRHHLNTSIKWGVSADGIGQSLDLQSSIQEQFRNPSS